MADEQDLRVERPVAQPYRVIGVTERPDPAAIAAAVQAFVRLRMLRLRREAERSNDS